MLLPTVLLALKPVPPEPTFPVDASFGLGRMVLPDPGFSGRSNLAHAYLLGMFDGSSATVTGLTASLTDWLAVSEKSTDLLKLLALPE